MHIDFIWYTHFVHVCGEFIQWKWTRNAYNIHLKYNKITEALREMGRIAKFVYTNERGVVICNEDTE